MIRRLFAKSTDPDIWISDSDPAPEKYVLVTVSGKDGEKTVLASSDKIFESKAKHFVQAPKERIVKGTDLYRQKFFTALKGLGYVLIVVLLTPQFSLSSTSSL
jgi:hypothetical protein